MMKVLSFPDEYPCGYILLDCCSSIHDNDARSMILARGQLYICAKSVRLIIKPINLEYLESENELVQLLSTLRQLRSDDLFGLYIEGRELGSEHNDVYLFDKHIPLISSLRGLRELGLRSTKITGRGIEHLRPFDTINSLDIGFTLCSEQDSLILTEFPNLSRLDISGTTIGTLDNSFLRRMHNLRRLDASYIHERRFNARNLVGMRQLCHLSLVESLDNLAIEDSLPSLTSLEYIDLSDNDLSEFDFRTLRGMTSLKTLYLVNSKINDLLCRRIANEDSLERLSVNENPDVSAVSLYYISRLHNLKELNLGNTSIDSESLSLLLHLRLLRTLILEHCSITDEAFECLPLLENLSYLDISDNPITDRTLSYLGKMRSMKQLSLSGTNITDQGLAYLQDSTRIENLDVSGTQVTEAGLIWLRNMWSLKSLSIGFNVIADQQIQVLKNLRNLQELRFLGELPEETFLRHLRTQLIGVEIIVP